ncbi:uncharacterized protein LOC135929725 [Gordionus sp. m RMFG-2023]|uniref:uncharacterized protein LOC135929725 n=1 Tax=Gordionus sp. m RMFG-2023 TaxID=3053472 RepID=UPI0031FE225E
MNSFSDPNVMICRRESINFTCENEDGDIINIAKENVSSFIKNYLKHTDHYILSPNLMIGIRLGRYENLTLNLVQETKPKVNITIGPMNSTTSQKLIEGLNGTLVISLGRVKRFRGPVSKSILIISSKDAKSCHLEHNDITCQKRDENNIIINSEFLNDTYEYDHYIIIPNLVIGISKNL